MKYYKITPKSCECCSRMFTVMPGIINDHLNNDFTVIHAVHGMFIATNDIEHVWREVGKQKFIYEEVSQEEYIRN